MYSLTCIMLCVHYRCYIVILSCRNAVERENNRKTTHNNHRRDGNPIKTRFMYETTGTRARNNNNMILLL